MINLADRQVGELMDLLRELGLVEKTLVIITGDNGSYEAFKSKEHPRGFFAPTVDPRTGKAFHGSKGGFYEGGLRVAAFANWPGRIKAGTVSDLLCSFTDMMPTLAEITGAKLPAEAEGLSIAPTLLGEPGQRQHDWLYWGIGPTACAVRMNQWKGVHRGQADWELYDLSADLGEEHDIAAAHPDIVARIKAIEQKAYTPIQPGEVLDKDILLKDRFFDAPAKQGKAARKKKQ